MRYVPKFEHGLYLMKRGDRKYGRVWWVKYYPLSGKRKDLALHRVPELQDELGPSPQPIYDKDEAKRLKKILDLKVHENRRNHVEIPPQSLHSMIQWCLEEYMPSPRKQASMRTIKGRGVVLKAFEAFTTGAKRDIAKISRDHIEKYLMHLEEEGRENSTIELHRKLLNAFFMELVKVKRVLRINPVAEVASRRVTQKRLPVLTDEQVRGMREHINPHYGPLLEFYLYTGARVMEPAKLKWGDMDFQNEIIRLPSPKSRGIREVYMVPNLRELFESLQHEGPDELVFVNQRGRPLDPSIVRAVFCKAASQSGVTGFTPKIFRHSYVSRLANRFPHFVVQQAVGHASVRTTEHYVSRLTEETRRAQASINWGDSRPERRVLDFT